jgi:hypothetical protein
MNQFEFDSMTAERLETYIMCQTESTDLEKMLVLRLIDADMIVGEVDAEHSALEDALDKTNDELESLEELIETIGKIANDEDDAEKAIEAILAEL